MQIYKDVLHIKISDEFDIDLSSCIVNVITL